MNTTNLLPKPTETEQKIIDSLKETKEKINYYETLYHQKVKQYLLTGTIENIEEIEEQLYSLITNYNSDLLRKGVRAIFRKPFPLGEFPHYVLQRPEIGDTRKLIEQEYKKAQETKQEIIKRQKGFNNEL